MGSELNVYTNTCSLCLADFMNIFKHLNYLWHHHDLLYNFLENVWDLDESFLHCAYTYRNLLDSIDDL